MREPLEMVTASRMQNMVEIRKKNTCFVAILLFRNVWKSSFGALCVESPHGLAICKLWWILLTLQTPKALRQAAGAPPTFAAESLFSHLRSVLSYCFHFWAAPKIVKNRTSSTSSQNLKNRTHGCPKLNFEAMLDDVWHHCFDQLS